MPKNERAFWQIVYRSLMAIAHAIKRYKLSPDCTSLSGDGIMTVDSKNERKGAKYDDRT